MAEWRRQCIPLLPEHPSTTASKVERQQVSVTPSLHDHFSLSPCTDRQSQPRNQAPQGAQCPVVQGTGQGIAHHSHDLLIGETGAAEASWLPQARQESAVPLILSASSRVALCILSTKSFADTNNIPEPVPLVFVGVESSLLNASAAPPDWELDKITSPEAKLHPGIRSCIIFSKDHHLEAGFNLWGGEKVTGRDAMRYHCGKLVKQDINTRKQARL